MRFIQGIVLFIISFKMIEDNHMQAENTPLKMVFSW